MMRLKAAVLAFLAISAVYGGGIETNYTPSVTVKGWKRHYVTGFADGTLADPSGKIASRAHAAGVEAAAKAVAQLADEARRESEKILGELYAKTNLISTFTKKIFVQAELYPDLTKLVNCWGKVVSEWTDGTNDVCMIYFSREFKVPPKISRRYRTELESIYVEGKWTDFDAPGKLVDGYEGCREIVFKRPEAVLGVNCFSRGYLKFGREDGVFDFGTRTFTIDGELYHTGEWTNALGRVWRFNNGVKTGDEYEVR